MTDDEVEAIFRDLRATFDKLEAEMARRGALQARASTAGEAPSDAGLDDLVRPMEILRDYDISRAELYRRCIKHPMVTPGGFSYRRDGEKNYLISPSHFDRHFRQHPPRRKRCETKKLRSETR